MPNTMIKRVKFITDEFYKNEYNTAFLREWSAIKSIEERDRFLELASIRIKSLVSRPFIDLNDLEFEQAEGVKTATARLVDYWIEYGLDLNRISGSVSLGSFSASQTAPKDPDYVPRNVFDTLQNVGLYTPIGFNLTDLERFDDDREITYGVRFKNLERVKDITIDKTDGEDDESHGNKNIHLITSALVDKKIKTAKLSPFNIIGTITVDSTTGIPTADEVNEDFRARQLVLDDGTIIVRDNPDETKNEEEAFDRDAIIFKNTATGQRKVVDYSEGLWEMDSANDALEQEIKQNASKISILEGSTEERAIKAKEGDTRYLMVSTDIPSTDQLYPKSDIDRMLKEANDKFDEKEDKTDAASAHADAQQKIAANTADIATRVLKNWLCSRQNRIFN